MPDFPTSGEVHFVPREVSLAGDPKDRRHVLAHDCDSGETGSVAYGTTQPTQVGLGAPHVVVAPRPSDRPGGIDGSRGRRANGFGEETFVFPALLTPVPVDLLDSSCGTLSDEELQAFHECVPGAIGVGQGTCWSRPREEGRLTMVASDRGSVVEFGPELKARLRGESGEDGIEFGIVLTRHELSRSTNAFQTIVPVVTGYEPLSPDELEFVNEPWSLALGDDVKSALVLVPETFYCHPSALRRMARQRVVSPETMTRIETTLVRRLCRCDSRGATAGVADAGA
jgi:hypothetical protein